MDQTRLMRERSEPARDTARSPFCDEGAIGDATELALSSAHALLTQIPLSAQGSNGTAGRSYAVTMFVKELPDEQAPSDLIDDKPVIVLQGLWRDGHFQVLDTAEPPMHIERQQPLLGPTLAELEEQQRTLRKQRRISRHLFTAAATLVFLLCGSVVIATSAWMTRNRAVKFAVEKKRNEMQRESDARLVAAAASAAQREATITQALRQESELRSQSEQQLQSIEAQRQLDTISREALGMILRGDAEHAGPKLQQALDILQSRSDVRGKALLLVSAAAAHQQKSNNPAAERLLAQAIDELSKLPSDPWLKIEAHTNLAAVCRAQHADAAALKHWTIALQMRERLWGGSDVRLIPTLQDMALTAFDLEQFAAVESIIVRIQSIRQQNNRAASPEAAADLSLLALAEVRQGKFDDATTACKSILLIEPALDQTQRQRLGGALTQLAHRYVEKGHYSQGMILLERAIRIADRYKAADLSPRDLDQRRLLAKLYMRERRYKQAEDIYRMLMNSREISVGNDDPTLADDAAELAELYERQERFGEAEALYRLAMTIRERVLGPYHMDVAKCAIHLADLYRVQGKTAKADALYDLARDIRKRASQEERQ